MGVAAAAVGGLLAAAERIGENPVDRSGLAVLLGLVVAVAGTVTAVVVVRRGRQETARRTAGRDAATRDSET